MALRSRYICNSSMEKIRAEIRGNVGSQKKRGKAMIFGFQRFLFLIFLVTGWWLNPCVEGWASSSPSLYQRRHFGQLVLVRSDEFTRSYGDDFLLEIHPIKARTQKKPGINKVRGSRTRIQAQPESLHDLNANVEQVFSNGRKRKASNKRKEQKQPNADKATSRDVASNQKKKKRARKSSSESKKQRKKVQHQGNQDSPYWSDPSDPVVIHHQVFDEDEGRASQCHKVRFKIRGNPLPLRRHRTSGGFIYNPSAKAQECFRKITESLIFHANFTSFSNNQTTSFHTRTTGNLVSELGTESFTTRSGRAGSSSQVMETLTKPLFAKKNNVTSPSLAMTIVFRTKRPLNHFVANTRGRPLKRSAPSAVCVPTRTDVDNLAKFVLDSLNELLYEDDHQIISLCVTKLLDSQDLCLGSTEVSIIALNTDNNNNQTNRAIEDLIGRTFRIYDE